MADQHTPFRVDEEYECRHQRIIDRASKVFSALGFEKASHRDIANATGGRSPRIAMSLRQEYARQSGMCCARISCVPEISRLR